MLTIPIISMEMEESINCSILISFLCSLLLDRCILGYGMSEAVTRQDTYSKISVLCHQGKLQISTRNGII